MGSLGAAEGVEAWAAGGEGAWAGNPPHRGHSWAAGSRSGPTAAVHRVHVGI